MTSQELSPNPVHSIEEALIGEKMLDQKGKTASPGAENQGCHGGMKIDENQ